MTIKDVALLLRISQEKGEGQDTLQNHRERLIGICNDRGYNFNIYEEIVSGASDMSDRNELNRLLADLHMYDAVMVISPDRIARRQSVAHAFVERLEKEGIPLITPERIYSERDMLLLSVEFAMASNEYKQITKRFKHNKLDRARRGEWIQGIPPIGYVRGQDKHLVIDPETAPLIQQIYNYAQDGYGLPTIAKMLKGYRTARGGEWTTQSIHNVLKNRVYLGYITYEVKKGKDKESIEKKGAHEPIISQEQFKAVQEALLERVSGDLETRTRNRGRVLSILNGLVFCSCGRKLGFRTDTRYMNLIYLNVCKCGMRGCAEPMLKEAFLREFIWLEIQLGDEWKKALEGANSHNTDILEQSVKELNKTAEKLNKRLKSIKIAKLDGELTKVEAEEIEQETKAELTQCQTAIDELQEQLQQSDVNVLENHYKTKMKLVQKFKQNQSDMETANRLLKSLIHKVHYKREPKGYIEYHEQMRMDEDEFITDIKVKIELK